MNYITRVYTVVQVTVILGLTCTECANINLTIFNESLAHLSTVAPSLVCHTFKSNRG